MQYLPLVIVVSSCQCLDPLQVIEPWSIKLDYSSRAQLVDRLHTLVMFASVVMWARALQFYFQLAF